jgi:hypothetical protein
MLQEPWDGVEAYKCSWNAFEYWNRLTAFAATPWLIGRKRRGLVTRNPHYSVEGQIYCHDDKDCGLDLFPNKVQFLF